MLIRTNSIKKLTIEDRERPGRPNPRSKNETKYLINSSTPIVKPYPDRTNMADVERRRNPLKNNCREGEIENHDGKPDCTRGAAG